MQGAFSNKSTDFGYTTKKYSEEWTGMALLITAFAALITANIWYCTDPNNSNKSGILCLIYTAAAIIMFVVDEVKYLAGNLVCFKTDFAYLLKDACLGFFVVILGFTICHIVIYTKCSKSKEKAVSRHLPLCLGGIIQNKKTCSKAGRETQSKLPKC